MNLEQILNGNIQTLINALRCAGHVYEQNADALKDSPRLEQQFTRQCAEVRRMADALEDIS